MVGHVIKVGNQDIFGYSRYVNFYKHVVVDAEDGELFVEVGSFLGQSTAAMAFFIKHSKKRIAFHAVDLFELTEFSDDPHFKVIEDHGGDFLAAFKNNLKGAEVEDYVTVVKASSLEAASQYEDRSISFLMIDASHKYEDVVDDIRAWYPKIKMMSHSNKNKSLTTKVVIILNFNYPTQKAKKVMCMEMVIVVKK